MSNASELTIREHCDSLRLKVDIARETAIDNLHKASSTLMTEIDAYERRCLSGWMAVKESTKHVVEDASKRMRAFLAEQHTFLQRVQERDDELTQLHLEEANKLAQELSNRKMMLKAAMFGNKLASFVAFPGIDDTLVSLGELAFSSIQIPFKTLGITDTDLMPIDNRAAYDFVLPLEHGQRFVTFKSPEYEDATQMSCFDRLGRLIASHHLDCQLKRETVAPSGPSQFVVCHESDTFQLSVYNSSLHCLRNVECKKFSNICCNSKFVFGLWDEGDSYESDSDDDDDDEDDDEQEGQECSMTRIQARHLDTLSKAFSLRVPEKYTIERIMTDEQHLVAVSSVDSKLCMSVFDLATCNRQGVNRGAKRAASKFSQIEEHVHLDFGPYFYLDERYFSSLFLLDGWLVVPLKNELVWFEKNGKTIMTASDTRTRLDNKNMKEFYASGSILLLTSCDGKLFLKR